MEVRLGVLADEAHVSNAGKLSINGMFDRIMAAKFPANHPYCMLTIVIRIGPWDEGEHALMVEMIDADGHVVFSFKTEFSVGEKASEENLNIFVPITGLPAPHPGDFSFEVYVDDRSVWSMPLRVEALGPSDRK